MCLFTAITNQRFIVMIRIPSFIYQIIFISFLLSSCAGSYHQIKPSVISYHAHNNLEKIDFYYKYDVNQERKNNKYAKKEKKKGIKVIAVQIQNNSNKPLVIKDDISFYANNQRIYPMEPLALKSMIKQQGGYYLFYLLFLPMTFNTYDTQGNIESSLPYGLVLGPALAIGNMIGASSANKNMTNEYSRENILTKTVEPGKKISGLLAFKSFDYPEITIQYEKD